MQIIDADGHVAENPSLAIEAMKRWPDHVTSSSDRKPRLGIGGRNYPEGTGPGGRRPPGPPRLYNQWIAYFCAPAGGLLRGVAVPPIEHGPVAVDVMREAKDLGL